MKICKQSRTMAILAISFSLVGLAAAQQKPSPDMQLRIEASQTGAFIENRGQWDPRVKFLARSGGIDSWVTRDGVVYDFHKFVPDAKETGLSTKFVEAPRGRRVGDVVRVTFAGARPSDARPGPELSGKVNYMIGNDRSKWSIGVRRFEEAKEEQIYKGISARYYFDHGTPRYDLVVGPGGDPSRVRMRFEGAKSIAMSPSGTLEIGTSVGTVEERGLYAYQLDGSRKAQVACRMSADGKTVGFQLGKYNRSKPLVIDPLIFSTYLGPCESCNALAVDSSGNIVVTGTTGFSSFPVTLGAYQTSVGPNYTAFVSKLSSNGQALLCSTYLGVSATGTGVQLDSSGDIVVAGYTQSSAFPVTGGAFQTTDSGIGNIGFIAKLSSDCGTLLFSTFLGGSTDDVCQALVLDSSGAPVVCGYTYSDDFPVTAGAYQTTRTSLVNPNCFIAKLSSDGSSMVFGTFLGGIGDDRAASITLDSASNAVLAGYTDSPDFPVTPGAFQTIYNGAGIGFVAKISSNGTSLIFGTYLGGSLSDYCTSVVLDSAGNPVVAGYGASRNFPVTVGAYQTTNRAETAYSNGFVTKLNSNGTALLFSTRLGGSYNDGIYGMALNSSGDPVVTGFAWSKDFPVTADAYQSIDNSFNFGNSFIAELSSNGSSLIYGTYLGGSNQDAGNAVALDSLGNPVVIGNTESSDFPTTAGALQNVNLDYSDGFVAKISIAAPPTTARVTVVQRLGAGTVPNGTKVTLQNDGGAPLSPPQSATTVSGVVNFATVPHSTATDGLYEIVVSVPTGGKGIPAVQTGVAISGAFSDTIYYTGIVGYVTQATTVLSPVAFATSIFGSVSVSTAVNGHTPVVWLPDGTYATSFSMTPGKPCITSITLGASCSSNVVPAVGYCMVNARLTQIYFTARKVNGTSYIPITGTWTSNPGAISVPVNGHVTSPSIWLPNGNYTGALSGATLNGSSAFNVGTPLTATGQRTITVG